MELTTRCIHCGSEFTDEQIGLAMCCPVCKTKSLPCAIKDDVQLKINWHELHILVVWAENWARNLDAKMPENDITGEPFNHLYTIMTIAQRLQRQFPDKNKLTLFSEMREIRESLKETQPGAELFTDLDDDSKLGF